MPAVATVSAVPASDKAVLKAVLKAMKKSRSLSNWSMHARQALDWKITFMHRDDKGGYVEYMTDLVVTNKAKKSGQHQSFHDSDFVEMIPASRVYLSMSSAMTAAQLLLKGAELVAEQSSGSTSSSQKGLSFNYLSVRLPGVEGELTLGSESVYCHGQRLISGAVE